MANYTTTAEATVSLNVSLARSGVREAIEVSWVHGLGGYLNPAQAHRLAEDLAAASDFADTLCPPRALKAVSG